MLADVGLSDVLAEVPLHPGGWLELHQAVIFLARRRMILGTFAQFANYKISGPDDIEDVVVKQHYKLRSLDGLITVKSIVNGWGHAIVWDSQEQVFRDPLGFQSSLTLVEWWPVTRLPEEYEPH